LSQSNNIDEEMEFLLKFIYILNSCVLCFFIIIRATKSQSRQNFSAFLKVYETSTNQISRSYHERLPNY